MVLSIQELETRGLTHCNAITGRIYLGLVNQMKLNTVNRDSKQRITFHQIKKNGRKLKQGAKSAVITYVDRDDEQQSNPVISFHRVFNASDVERVSSGTVITDKQKYLLTKLIKKRYAYNPNMIDSLLSRMNELSASKASELIKQMMEEKQEIAA